MSMVIYGPRRLVGPNVPSRGSAWCRPGAITEEGHCPLNVEAGSPGGSDDFGLKGIVAKWLDSIYRPGAPHHPVTEETCRALAREATAAADARPSS